MTFLEDLLASTTNDNSPAPDSDALTDIILHTPASVGRGDNYRTDIFIPISNPEEIDAFTEHDNPDSTPDGYDYRAYRQRVNPKSDKFLEQCRLIREGLIAQILAHTEFADSVRSIKSPLSALIHDFKADIYYHLLREVNAKALAYSDSKRYTPELTPALLDSMVNYLLDPPDENSGPQPYRMTQPNLLASRLLDHPLAPVPCGPDTWHYQLPKHIQDGNAYMIRDYNLRQVRENPHRALVAGSNTLFGQVLFDSVKNNNALTNRGKGPERALLLDDSIPKPTLGTFAAWDGIATLKASLIQIAPNMIGDGGRAAYAAFAESQTRKLGFVPHAIVTLLTPTLPATHEHRSHSHVQSHESQHTHSLPARNKSHARDEYERIAYGISKLMTVAVGEDNMYSVLASEYHNDSSITANRAAAQHYGVMREFLHLRPTYVTTGSMSTGYADPYTLDGTRLNANWLDESHVYPIDTGYRAMATSFRVYLRMDEESAYHDWVHAYCRSAAQYYTSLRLSPYTIQSSIAAELAEYTRFKLKLGLVKPSTPRSAKAAAIEAGFASVFGDS